MALRARQFQNIDDDGCLQQHCQWKSNGEYPAGAQFELLKLRKEFIPRHKHTIPSKLNRRRMNSRRLQWVHRLTRGFLVQINIPDHRHTLPKLEADVNPILGGRPTLCFTIRTTVPRLNDTRSGRSAH